MSRDPRRRSQVRMKCGQERFPKSALAKIKLEPDRFKQLRIDNLEPPVPPCKCLADEQKTYDFSNDVLIHGWQKRRFQVKPVANCSCIL